MSPYKGGVLITMACVVQETHYNLYFGIGLIIIAAILFFIYWKKSRWITALSGVGIAFGIGLSFNMPLSLNIVMSVVVGIALFDAYKKLVADPKTQLSQELIGKSGVVLEVGDTHILVSIDNKPYLARSDDKLKENDIILVVAIDGMQAVVRKQEEEIENNETDTTQSEKSE